MSVVEVGSSEPRMIQINERLESRTNANGLSDASTLSYADIIVSLRARKDHLERQLKDLREIRNELERIERLLEEANRPITLSAPTPAR